MSKTAKSLDMLYIYIYYGNARKNKEKYHTLTGYG